MVLTVKSTVDRNIQIDQAGDETMNLKAVLRTFFSKRAWGRFHFIKNIYLLKSRGLLPGKRSFMNDLLGRQWGSISKDQFPKDRRMKIIGDNGIAGMSSENIRLLINEIVKSYAEDGLYVEVGSYQGCSLISAALYNTNTTCIGIDDFSQFDPSGVNEKILRNNILKFPELADRVEFYNMDYKLAVPTIMNEKKNKKVNVYFYDGEHSYFNQVRGLEIILPYLSDKCIIIVDDLNYGSTDKANRAFLELHPDFKSILRIRTSGVDLSENLSYFGNWHNGIEVIARGF